MVCGYLSQQTKNTILCAHVVPVPLWQLAKAHALTKDEFLRNGGMEGILVLTFWLYLHIFVCVSSKIHYTDQSIGQYLLISESHDYRCIKIMLLAMLSAVKNICEWMGLCKDLIKFQCGIATGYHRCNTSVLEISSSKDIPWPTVSGVAAKCKCLGTY